MTDFLLTTIDASSCSFHGVFTQEKWDVRVHNISDNTDFNTVSSRMVNQVQYFITTYFFDIHGKIFIKIWS